MMSMPRIKKNETWLLVFIGIDEEQTVRKGLLKASEITNRKLPSFHIKHISKDKAQQIPSCRCVDNEVSETFNEVILNDIIVWKSDYKATQIAIILPSRAFSSDEVFVQVVNDRIFKEPNYHAICSRGNFINTQKRKQCVKTTACTQCNELAKECIHSCVIRLMWLMFESKYEQVLEVFDNLD